MRRSLLLGTVVLLFASVALAADVDKVTLKNGDRFSGTIVSGDGKTLLLKTEFAGDITIKWDAVTAIDSSQDLHLTLKDGQQHFRQGEHDGRQIRGHGPRRRNGTRGEGQYRSGAESMWSTSGAACWTRVWR